MDTKKYRPLTAAMCYHEERLVVYYTLLSKETDLMGKVFFIYIFHLTYYSRNYELQIWR